MTAFVTGHAGAVGKVPWRAEYLPVPAHAPSFAAFDGWLTEAFEYAARVSGSGWSDAFGRGAMHGFVFHAAGDPADTVLCGALTPSRDSAGRQFPLALGAPLRVVPDLLRRPELVPFTLEGFWGQATAALADLMNRPEPTPISLVAGPEAELAEAAELYDHWKSTLPLVELWQLLGPALGEPAATLRLVSEALSPLRGVESPDATLSLRLPLGIGGGATLCFWIDLVRRCLGWLRTLPSFFWSHDGTSGTALLHLGRPSKAALAELWLPTAARDDIVDLTSSVGAELVQAFSPLPPNVAGRVYDPEATLGQLLAAVAV
jgi:type VI secretion system ImpM family protein